MSKHLKNKQVIDEFIKHKESSVSSHNNNLKYLAYYGELMNYNTVIGRWMPGKDGWKIQVNLKNYSRTTTTIQNAMMNAIKQANIAYEEL